MAFTTQILQDGPRNCILKVTGNLAASTDEVRADIIDPATLSPVDNYNNLPCTQVAIREVEFSVNEPVSVRLFWDATADVQIITLTQADQLCFDQPLQNNAGAGKTGKIQLDTVGGAFNAAVKAYTIVLDLIKQ